MEIQRDNKKECIEFKNEAIKSKTEDKNPELQETDQLHSEMAIDDIIVKLEGTEDFKVKMGEKTSNIVSHMCGYCSKIYEGEHNLDKHIEEFHFLAVLNEEVKEEEDDESMANVDIDTNEDNLNEVAEEDEAIDQVDMTLGFEEYLDINVKKENNPEDRQLDIQEELKPKKVLKVKKTYKDKTDESSVTVFIKSETNDIIEEDQIATAEQKKIRKREKDRLKKQRRRQRQLESGDLNVKKPRKLSGLESKESSSSPHRDWSPFYQREGDMMRCLGCLAEYGALHQVHRHLTTSSFCGQGVGLKTEATYTKTTSPLSQAPRRDYQGLYLKGEETWICTKCGHEFRSDHGVHAHLKVTTCGFGTREPKPQHINYQSMYRKAGDEYECTSCGVTYKSQRGVHHHLKSTHCGFGTHEAKTHKKTSFKSLYSKEGEVYMCKACGAEYKSGRGVYHHLKTTHCGFGVGDTKPKKVKKEENKEVNNLYSSLHGEGGSVHICNLCNVDFMSAEDVVNHLKMTNCIQLNTAGAKE